MRRRPVSTYSIIACDETSFGAAVQSHWFAVGSVVPWLEPGVGGVVVQSITNPSHGTGALALLKRGRSAAEALATLLRDDREHEFRQIAIVDRDGRVVSHTGDKCFPEAGSRMGDTYAAQANIMSNTTIWDAMGDAFEASEGDLAHRLMDSLRAAERAGGDIRGRQSAALLVVSRSEEAPMGDPIFDLRVDDHPDPLAELERLILLRRAYMRLNEGDALMARDRMDEALTAYRSACEMLPDSATNGEAAFWTGIAFAGTGSVEEAGGYLARAQRQDPNWSVLLPRLTRSGVLPSDEALIATLTEAMMRGPH